MKNFLQVYNKFVDGAISGWDRIRFRGTIRWLAHTSGINTYLNVNGILLKDFEDYANSITKKVVSLCTARAEELGIPMIYLNSAKTDKEAYARRIMKERNMSVGDICMFSTVEPCIAPLVKGNKATKKLELTMAPRKCKWIYHYWNDEKLGFGHTRLQTWLPLNVTVNLNGRHWLERQLIEAGVDFVKDGNCFTHLSNYTKAQELLDAQNESDWPKLLDGLLQRICPGIHEIFKPMPLSYYWSADETEQASDIVFKSKETLDRLFPMLVRYGMLIAQSPAVMRFLGRLSNRGSKPNEVTSDCRKRYEGVRIKHFVNKNSVKLYNKAGNVLRAETTINQTRDFKVYRHPNDDTSKPASWQKMRKGVSDLHRRSKVSKAANERYLDSLASIKTGTSLQETIGSCCKRRTVDGKNHRALNLFSGEDLAVLQFLARGENALNGFRNKNLREHLYGEQDCPILRKSSSSKTSRRLRLLRAHGLIKKVPKTSRYVVTEKGCKVTNTVIAASAVNNEQLMEMVV